MRCPCAPGCHRDPWFGGEGGREGVGERGVCEGGREGGREGKERERRKGGMERGS